MKKLLAFLLLLLLSCCQRTTPTYGPYSIGRDPTWFPLPVESYVNNLNAFTNALVQEMAKLEKVNLEIIDIDWLQLLPSLEKGEIAGMFTSLSPTIITSDKYSFSEPFVMLGPVLVVREDSSFTALNQMEGKIVAVNQYDDSILLAQQYSGLIINLYSDPMDALEALSAGVIDGMLMSTIEAQALVPSLFASKLKIVTQPLTDKALRLITLKGKNGSLLKHFNAGLSRLCSKGIYQQLRQNFELANRNVHQNPIVQE